MAASNGWYYAAGSQSVRPLSLEQLVARLRQAGGLDTYVFGPGLADWTEARHVKWPGRFRQPVVAASSVDTSPT